MIKIRLQQAEMNTPQLAPSIDIGKVQNVGYNLNVVISTSYLGMVNAATYFITDYLALLKNIPEYRGRLKYMANKTKVGMSKFDRTFKYEFPNLKVWQNSIDLTDAISDKIAPACKGIYFAVSNELGKSYCRNRDLLANMMVAGILLRQAMAIFDDALKRAYDVSGFDFRPYFSHLSAKCIEYPFSETFMIVADIYKIDALALTRIEPVRIGINAVLSIIGDENTYREAKESVENG